MLLFIEIYLFLFSIFKLNWYQYYFFRNHWLIHIILRLSKSSYFFLFYLFMPVDNTTWHARVGMFCTLKPLVKSKLKSRRKVPFLLHPAYFSFLFLFDVAMFQLNNVQYVFNCMLRKIFTICYPHFITKLFKVANIAIFLFFCMQNLLIVVILRQILVLDNFCNWY